MILSLPPRLQRFVDDQVRAGRFPSPEAVIEAAILDMRDTDDFDDATIAAISEAEGQADRGEGMDLDTFRAHMNNRIADRG